MSRALRGGELQLRGGLQPRRRELRSRTALSLGAGLPRHQTWTMSLPGAELLQLRAPLQQRPGLRHR
jgi:hypothetical protein